MNISKQDKIEIEKINAILTLIDNIDNNKANTITDEINKYQPFLISLMLGYRLDMQPEQTEDIIKIVFLIWEFFKECNGIKNKKLTEDQFERLQKRNIGLLKYLEGEPESDEKRYVTSSDLGNLRSKALLTGIFYRFKNQKSLIEMDVETKGIVLIGLKSLIECFEEIERNNM